MHHAPHEGVARAPAGASTRCVFVYGTLRQGGANDITRLAPPPRLVGKGSIAGTMFDLGRYPGVVLGGGGRVVGEVYAIEPALERLLDEIEEIYPQQTDEYFRREVEVVLDGQAVPCLVYEINSVYVAGKPVLAQGDWMAARHGIA